MTNRPQKSLPSLFAASPAQGIAALGEARLIARIQRWLGDTTPPPPHGIGDDCAVLPPSAGAQVITTDPVIFGQHFDASVPPRWVGAKLLKRNLSDLAAMGARPSAAVIALTLDPRVSVEWLAAFHRGLAATARAHHVPIVGGDVAQCDGVFVATLTLLGTAAGRRLLTREGAQAGDSIWVTGPLGGSRAGHHYRFTPRLAEGAWLAAQREVVAMMDVSDGVAKDVWSLTPRGLVAAISPEAIPLSRAALAGAQASGRPAWQHALTDGEDYELMFVLRAGAAETPFIARAARADLRRMHRIGTFVRGRHPGKGCVEWKALHGYEHFGAA